MVLRHVAIRLLLTAILFSLSVEVQMARAAEEAPTAPAPAPDVAAFNSAKALGTVEAWNAFLASYPTGFYADLARAYLRTLKDRPTAATPAAPVTYIAQELSCTERSKVRSLNSDAPTKVTFVNASQSYRSIQWIDFEGKLKDYGTLSPGEQITLDTYVTHPWLIGTRAKECLHIFMPDAGPATVELARLADAEEESRPATKEKQPEEPAQKKSTLVCAKNYKLRNGECVLVQNCGANATRSPEGDCYCNKNYMMSNGKCIWKQDKKGFEVAPWKKQGCSTWQKQCSQGSKKACAKYETTCQVN